MALYPNKRAGTCKTCSATVAVRAGFIARAVSGGWDVFCNSNQCIPASLQQKHAAKDRKELTKDGELYFPYDPEALSLLRSFPRTRDRNKKTWDPEKKCRHVSLEAEDRPRVLELCEQLGISVAEELKTVPLSPSVLQAQTRALKIPTLRDFQMPGIEFLARRRCAILADDMGLGKTFQALMAADAKAGVLVVCPSSLKYNWAAEVQKWRPDLTPEVMEGRGSFQWPRPGEVVITNFEILPKWLLPVKVAEKEDGTNIEAAQVPNLPSFRRMDPKNTIFIVDEAQRVKNPRTQVHKKVRELARICGRTWFLTGTPIESRPADLWGVLQAGHMARAAFEGWGDGSWGFTRCFQARKVRVSRKQFAWEWGSPLPEVPERLRRVMLRRLKEDVLTELPPTVWSDLMVNVAGKQLQLTLGQTYDRVRDFLDRGQLPPFEEISKARAAIAASRVPAMLDFVVDYEEAGQPLVVFSAYKAPIEKLGERDGWEVITGDVSAAKRQEIVREFQAGNLKGIGLTIGAGGTGLTLTQASTVLFVDLDWVPARNAQAVDRIRRIGQTASSIQVVRMVSDHPVDRRVHAILAEKMELIQKAVEERVEYAQKASQTGTPIKAETPEEHQARMDRIQTAARQRMQEEAKRQLALGGWLQGERVKASGRPEVDLTPQVVVSLRDALEYMLNRCDGAQARDAVGFNKPDAGRARVLQTTGLTTEAELRTAERLLSRYYNQLHTKYPQLFADTQTQGISP